MSLKLLAPFPRLLIKVLIILELPIRFAEGGSGGGTMPTTAVALACPLPVGPPIGGVGGFTLPEGPPRGGVGGFPLPAGPPEFEGGVDGGNGPGAVGDVDP